MIAILREVSPSMNECELTHLAREPIDVERAREQHRAYADTLASLGCTIELLPGDAAQPDCVFVEDTVIALDELAILTRPGAESRRGEVEVMANAMARHRRLARIEAPGTIDGGDVLRIGRTIYIGVSQRTNEAAIEQVHAFASGYDVVPVRVTGCLHLKSAITEVADGVLLANREWIDMAPFAGFTIIDAVEPFGANALRIGGSVVYPTSFPRTLAALKEKGVDVRAVDASEVAKAEGGVTCCSVLFSSNLSSRA